MDSRGHGIIKIEGPRHDTVDQYGVLGRYPPSMYENCGLLASPHLSVEPDQRLASLGPGTRNGRPENRQHHVSDRVLGPLRYAVKFCVDDVIYQCFLHVHAFFPPYFFLPPDGRSIRR